MKGRLSSTVGLVLFIYGIALLAVLALGYSAGTVSAGRSPLDFTLLSRNAGFQLAAGLVLLGVATFLGGTLLTSRIVNPARELVTFSEQLADGYYKAATELEGSDEFGLVAANLKTTAERAALAVATQQAQADLQRSITDFLTIVSQIARGDLTLRGM